MGDPLASALTQLIPGLLQPPLLQQLQAPGLQSLGNLGQMSAAAGLGAPQASAALGNLASIGHLGAMGATEPGVGAMQAAGTMPGMFQFGADGTTPVASLPTTPAANLPIGGGDGFSSTAPGTDGTHAVPTD